MQHGHSRESSRCGELGFSEWNCLAQLSGGISLADVWRGAGWLSCIPLRVLLYDDLVGIVTSRHVTKIAVTPFNPPLPKILCIRKVHGSIFYRTGIYCRFFTFYTGRCRSFAADAQHRLTAVQSNATAAFSRGSCYTGEYCEYGD